MNKTILVAEDDSDIVELLRLYLENDGYSVVSADNGEDALALYHLHAPILAVVDIMMPRMNGYELMRALRAESDLPLIVLSAKNTDHDKILGLNLGADDYLAKPFNPLELLARIRALLRRTANLVPVRLTYGALSLDTGAMTLFKNGETVALTPMEYKILVFLMRTPGRVFTKVQIYENINGAYFESDDNTMMVHISKLREKIEDDPKNPRYIITVRGLGYKFEKG